MSVRALRRGAIAASRVSAPTSVTVADLSTDSYASTPDTVANSIVSDIDIRLKLAMDDWTAGQGFVSKWSLGTGQRSYRFFASGIAPGRLEFELSSDGTSSAGDDVCSVGHGFTAGSVHWIRVTWTNSDNVVKYYTSNDGSTWTQLGDNGSISSASIFNSTAALMVGSQNSGGGNVLEGLVYYAEVRNGVDGTVAAKFDPSTVTKLGTRNPSSFVSSTGETWTMNGTVWDWATA